MKKTLFALLALIARRMAWDIEKFGCSFDADCDGWFIAIGPFSAGQDYREQEKSICVFGHKFSIDD